MIDKIDTNQPLMESGSSPKQSNSAGAVPDKDADVSVQVNYASLIEKAAKKPKTDPQLIQRARKLLLSGQLETSQNIREAAESIIKFGI